MCRNLALPLGQDFLKFGDGELFLFQKKQQAETVGVGRQTYRF